MEHRRERRVSYGSQVVGGLVACAVVAVSLHAHVAALAILVAVTFVVLAITPAALRDNRY